MQMATIIKPTLTGGLGLNTDSFTPYYQQIVDQIRALVKSGVLQEGDIFHSEGEVAKALGISKMPVRQAFARLRAEGLLVIERGKRPVVGSEKVSWDFRRLHGFSEEMKRRGLRPGHKVLELKQMPAGTEIARPLQLTASAIIYRFERLYYVSDEPVAIVVSYLPSKLFPELEQQDLEGTSLYHLFEHVYQRHLKWAEEEIGAVEASEQNAVLMKIKPSAALVRIKETAYDTRNVPVEFSVSLLRSDRYTVTVQAVRQGSPPRERRRQSTLR